MKDIKEYFAGSGKASGSVLMTTTDSHENSKEIIELNRVPRAKRNRVKIKISRTSADDRVCDIIENSTDMIDKTPSPFGSKVNNVGKNLHGRTRRRSASRLKMHADNVQDVDNQMIDSSDVWLESHNHSSVKRRKKRERNDSGKDGNDKKKDKNMEDKSLVSNGRSTSDDSSEGRDIDVIDLGTKENSNDEVVSQREESNVFQILMNRNKPVQNVSPKKMSSLEDDLCFKKSEEYKEKLKRSKENLIAMADKKGYTKRKLVEIEEGEKIEQKIQNRIKAFKGEEKKTDNDAGIVIANQRQSSGSLLNYFSKVPMELAPKDTAEMSTFIVKADVHMSENSGLHLSKKLNSKNGINQNRKDRKSNVDLSQIEDIITVIDSENISVPQNERKQHPARQRNKHRWSLRIKFQANENHNALNDESTDEEIFSRSKAKINTNRSNLDVPNSTITEATDFKTQTRHSKLKLKRNESLKNYKDHQEDADIEDNNIKMKNDSNSEVNICNINLRSIRKYKSNDKDWIFNNNNNGTKRKSIDKLAPLFTKRRKPDPETITARRLFLQPDMSESDVKSTEQKVHSSGALPFPVISHVTQLNDASLDKSENFNIKMKIETRYVPTLDVNNYKHILDRSETNTQQQKNLSKPNIQDALTDIERRCSNAKKMWNTIISVVDKEQRAEKKSLSSKIKAKKKKLSKRKAEESTSHANADKQFGASIWTDKYKPAKAEEVVGNEEAATKLKDWLTGWRVSVVNDDNASSGDEFYSSDCSYSNSNINNQVAVLLGPHGSGKSASIYAVAEELGYTVLEVNASSRRTGKKLLKELEEATKSHRIKKDKSAVVVPLSYNSISDETILQRKISQNSLILLEDIDLIFEEDEGFVSATYQLASNTKRPIVMTCRDICPHLNKLAPQQNRIYFQSACGDRVSALLDLISLAETGYKLPHACIAELLQAGDLRKALLQLQYLLLSGPPQILEQRSVTLGNLFWQNMRYCLYKPAIKMHKTRKAKSKVKTSDTSTTDVLNNIARKLDSIALMSSLIQIEDLALNLTHTKPEQPNLTFTEDTAAYTVSHSISSDIADWIGTRVMCKDQLNNVLETPSQNNTFLLRKQLNRGVDLALSQATSLVLDRRALSVDYLPSVREICRAEDFRANVNNKRGNRFYHYLNSLKISNTSLRPNILAAACRTMRDKVNDSAQSE